MHRPVTSEALAVRQLVGSIAAEQIEGLVDLTLTNRQNMLAKNVQIAFTA